jgi:hypothetical protein
MPCRRVTPETALWPYDLMALWPYGLMALWPYGLMALWPYGLMAVSGVARLQVGRPAAVFYFLCPTSYAYDPDAINIMKKNG